MSQASAPRCEVSGKVPRREGRLKPFFVILWGVLPSPKMSYVADNVVIAGKVFKRLRLSVRFCDLACVCERAHFGHIGQIETFLPGHFLYSVCALSALYSGTKYRLRKEGAPSDALRTGSSTCRRIPLVHPSKQRALAGDPGPASLRMTRLFDGALRTGWGTKSVMSVQEKCDERGRNLVPSHRELFRAVAMPGQQGTNFPLKPKPGLNGPPAQGVQGRL
jgi:hypothetical protein